MNLKRPLESLEQALPAPPKPPCRTCGYYPGAPIECEASFEPYEGPDRCPECGRLLHIELRFPGPPERKGAQP